MRLGRVLNLCTMLVMASSARAQLFLDPATDGWSNIPTPIKECVARELAAQGKDFRSQIRLGLLPTSPQAKGLMDQCAPNFFRAQPYPGAADFAQWFNTEILSKPLFAKAFGRCRAIVSLYQDKILEKLAETASNATSKKDQQTIQHLITGLKGKQSTNSTTACVKQFLGSLNILGSSAVASELSMLAEKIRRGGFDLSRAAAAKLEDLTDQGLLKLASDFSLGSLAQSEIDNGLRTLLGYPTYLLPHDWPSPYWDIEPNGEKVMDKTSTEIAVHIKPP